MRKTLLVFNRFLSLFLAFLFGFFSFAGILVGAGFIAYNNLSVDFLNKFGANISTEEYFDPNAEVPVDSLTIKQMIAEVEHLSSLGEEVNFDMLAERYGLKMSDEVASFIPEDIRTLPFTEIFAEDGLYKMLECVEVSYVLKYVPEDVISDPLVHKLKSRTLADVVDMDMGYLFDGIEVGYILGVNYEKNADGEYVMVPADPNKMTIMEILAPIDLGDVLADAQAGKLNVLEVIDENLADVTIAHLVNAFESVELPEALGGKTLGELISVDENGSFYIDIAGVTKGIDIGGLLGYYYDEADGKWYVDDGKSGDERTEADAIFAPICGITIDELLEPEEGKTVIDVVVDAFADSNTRLGDLLGYYYDEADGKWYVDNGKIGDERTEADAIFAPICGIGIGDILTPEEGETVVDVVVEAFADSNTTIGTLLGYVYDETDGKWYVDDGKTGAERTEADAIFAPFCGIEVAELIRPEEGSDIFDVVIGALDDAGTTVGTLMGYTYDETDGKWYVDDGKSGDERTEADAIFAPLCGIKVSSLIEPEGDKTIIDTVVDAFADAKTTIGTLIGYVYDETDGKWYVDDGKSGDERTEADAIFAPFCDVKIAELLRPEEGSTAFDVILGALKDSGTTLGSLMGYVYDETDGKWYVDDGKSGSERTEADAIFAPICGITVGSLLDPEEGKTAIDTVVDAFADAETKLGTLMGYVYDEADRKWYVDDGKTGAERTEAGALLDPVCGVSVTDLIRPEEGSTAVDVILDAFTDSNTKIGEIMGYVYDETDGKWYVDDGKSGDERTEADAIFAPLCGVTIGSLLEPGEGKTAVDTLLDAFAESETKLGSLMGYVYDETDGHWYVDDGKSGSERTPADALFEPLCDVLLGDLLKPEDGSTAVDVIKKAFADSGSKLGNIMGYVYDETDGHWYVDDGKTGDERTKADAIFEPICGVAISDILDPEEGKTAADIVMDSFSDSGIRLGDIMGYYYDETDSKWYLDNGATGTERTEADAFFAPICNAKLSDLLDPAPGTSAADIIMDQYQIAGTKLGSMMGYVYDESDGKWYRDDGKIGDERTPADALFAPLCSIALYELIDHPENKPADQVLIDKFKESDTRFGDLMGYTKINNPDYTDGSDVNEFLWSDKNGNDIIGVGATIAEFKLSDVLDGNLDTDEIIDSLTLGEVFGLKLGESLPVYIGSSNVDISDKVSIKIWLDEDENRANSVIAALADVKISELMNKVTLLKVASILDLVEYDDDPTDSVGAKYYSWDIVQRDGNDVIELTLDDSVTSEFAGINFDSLLNGELEEKLKTIQVGKLLGFTQNTDGDWVNSKGAVVGGVLGIVAGATTSTLEDTINETKIGSVAGYVLVDGTWYEEYIDETNNIPADGIIAALADITVKDLSSEDTLRTKIEGIKIYSVLGYRYDEVTDTYYEKVDGVETPVTGLMAAIAGATVGTIDSVIDETKVGDVAGFDYVNGKWYDSYTDESNNVPAKGILGALADLTVKQLSSEEKILEKVQDVHIYVVLGYRYDEATDTYYEKVSGYEKKVSGIMSAIAGATVGNVDSVINETKVGSIAGYVLHDGKWYVSYTDESNNTPVSGILGSLADLSVKELSNETLLRDKVRTIKISEVLNYRYDEATDTYYDLVGITEVPVSGIMAIIAGATVGNVDSVIDNTTVGDIAGYVEVDGKWYESYTSDTVNTPVSGILGSLAGLSVKELSNETLLREKVQGIKIYDVLGYEYDSEEDTYYEYISGVKTPVSGIMAVIAGATVGNVDSVIDDTKVGDIAGYVLRDGKWYVSYISETVNTPVSGILGSLADLSVKELSSETLLREKVQGIKICDVLGYEYDSATDTYYEYISGVKTPFDGIMAVIAGATVGNVDSVIDDTTVGDIAGYVEVDGEWYVSYTSETVNTPVSGILGSLAALSVKDLSNEELLRGKVQGIKIYDVLGYEYDSATNTYYEYIGGVKTPVDGIMAVIAGASVGNVDSVIDDTTVGDIAGYVEVDGEWYVSYTSETVNTPVSGILGSLAALSVKDLSNEALLRGKVQGIKIYDVLGYEYDSVTNIYYEYIGGVKTPVSGIMAVIAGASVGNVDSVINDTKIADIAGYTYKDGKWFTDPDCINEAHGVLVSFADLTVGHLTDEAELSGRIQGITIADVFSYQQDTVTGYWYYTNADGTRGSRVTGVMAAIAGSKISDISTTINSKKMGDLLGYTYSNRLDSNGDPITGEYWWYDADGKAVHPLMNKVSGEKFSELNKLADNLTIGDIILEEDRQSGYLSLIASDTKLSKLPEALDGIFDSVTIGQLCDAGVIKVKEGATLNDTFKAMTINQLINSISTSSSD